MAPSRRPEPPSRGRARPVPAVVSLVVLLALAFALSGPLLAARYAQGERVQVTGLVSDKQGQPLPNLRVVLEASRSYFSFREFRRAQKEVRRVSTMTNAKGEYTLVWPWDSYFNRFELVVGVPVRKTQGERVEELARQDVTQRLLAGNPAVVTLAVENTRFLESLRAFVASVQSEDERRVYDEMGKPDEVKRVQYPDHVEASWWYFESGKVYRFRDGRLEQVVPFDPVKGR
jgi:hypothetical protein